MYAYGCMHACVHVYKYITHIKRGRGDYNHAHVWDTVFFSRLISGKKETLLNSSFVESKNVSWVIVKL